MLIKELKTENTNHIGCTLVQEGYKNFYVSTVETPYSRFNKYETEVFKCGVKGEVTDWTALYQKQYNDISEAIANHKYICEHLVEILGGEK